MVVLASALLALPSRAADNKAAAAQFGTHDWVEYREGDLPIVLTAPHGGRLTPASLPDRTAGVTTADSYTQELAHAIAAAFSAATRHSPHVVASLLHRRKLDPNREIHEAAAGNPAAERAWQEFHAFIRQATGAAVARHGFAFLVDIHGHAHPLPRVEIGYGLTSVQLNQADQTFDATGLARLSTVRDLHTRDGGSGASLIRGERSLGSLLAAKGIRAVPSGPEPQPGAGAFFSGGYIVVTHAGAPATTQVDGVQLEHYRVGLRDTAKNREAYAAILVEALKTFLWERYAFDLSSAGSRPPRSESRSK